MRSATEKRKLSHIKVTLQKKVESHKTGGFEDVDLVHRALPELDRVQVDLSTELFGHKLNAPVMVESMTGGTPTAAKLNGILAETAEELGLAMGVGSQRAALENPELAYTYKIVREKAPSIFLFANIGCPQLREEDGLDRARRAVEMIEADALYIHLNALQECIQFEGETNFSGVLGRISKVSKELGVPVLAKETGAGVSREVAMALQAAGVSGISVSGVGGTSWAAVEYYRALERSDALHERMGELFWDWGIPTCVSIVEAAKSTNRTIIASGGMRNGLQAAKAIALGASAVGFARPMLEAAAKGKKALAARINNIMEELRTTMFLTGSNSVHGLQRAPVVITGKTASWLQQRGFDTSEFAKRG